ncbi:MAG: glycosyltransferase family 2 protein [Planctomycetaceae bacterium]
MNPSQPVTVSVVIPCFNAATYIHEAISSALNQTYRPLEVLVIDDGSTDESAEVAASFGEPVRVIQQPNQGESVARNRGIDEARGDWIAFLDADDVWKPEKLERQIALIDDGVVCIHTAVFEFGSRQRVNDVSLLPPEVRYDIENLSVKGLIHPSSALVRRSARGRFPTWTQYSEDQFYFLDLVREGEIRMVAAPLSGHRNHAANQSSMADIEVHRHQAILEWLDRNSCQLSERQVANIRRRRHDGLVYEAVAALAIGRMDTFRRIRRYALGHGPFMPAACRVLCKAIGQQTWALLSGRKVILPY